MDAPATSYKYDLDAFKDKYGIEALSVPSSALKLLLLYFLYGRLSDRKAATLADLNIKTVAKQRKWLSENGWLSK
jgi:hypothetical protein